MKNNLITSTILASSLFFTTQSFASNYDFTHWSVGVGSYAFTLSNDNRNSDDEDFGGLSITAAYAFNNHIQVRATYFSLENEDYSDLKSTGYDLMAYGGAGFTRKGFRSFGGFGFFSDKWKESYHSESFSNIQLGGGIGYSWDKVAVDLILKLRKADEYEDVLYYSGSYVAMSGNLSVSYLF